MNLQSVAANIGYEFASRQPVGCPVAPEPETFEEAVQQLQADRRKRAGDESTRRAAVTAEDSEDVRCHKILSTLDTYVHKLDALFFGYQEEIEEKDMEPFGDVDDATLKRLGEIKQRSKYEEDRYQKLLKLRYLKTRTMRSRARRISTISDDAERIASYMKDNDLDNAPLQNKLPDFKLQQIQGYFTTVPGRQLTSPFCLVTNPQQKEEDFLKKFKENEEKK